MTAGLGGQGSAAGCGRERGARDGGGRTSTRPPALLVSAARNCIADAESLRWERSSSPCALRITGSKMRLGLDRTRNAGTIQSFNELALRAAATE